jgi:hypothetical protein
VADGGEQVAEVAAVQAGDGIAEADGDAAGEAGGEPEDPLLAAGAGEFTDVERGDSGGPVDGGHRGGAVSQDGGVADEAAGEVVTVEEGAVRDEQADSSFGRVNASGAGPQGCRQRGRGHGIAVPVVSRPAISR